MAKVVFEGMFILESNSYARDPGGAAVKIKDLIEGVGGTLLASRLWNEQRLAFPINGHRKGVYWLTYFELESTQFGKFNRAVQLTDSVLRHLALRIDPRLVGPMVAAAKGEQPMPSRAAKVEEKSAPHIQAKAHGESHKESSEEAEVEVVE